MKDQFTNYIKNVTNSQGYKFDELIVNIMIEELDLLLPRVLGIGKSLFSVTDIIELQTIRERLSDRGDLHNYNQERNRGVPNQAILNYIKFLKELDIGVDSVTSKEAMEEKDLTDGEKLEEIRKIIDTNLFSIFASFVLDMDNFAIKDEDHKVESYVRLKELLGIERGISMNNAKRYDDFKKRDQERYSEMMTAFDNQILSYQKYRVISPWKGFCDTKIPHVSHYMFTTACYPLLINSVSPYMSDTQFKKTIEGIKKYEFRFE